MTRSEFSSSTIANIELASFLYIVIALYVFLRIISNSIVNAIKYHRTVVL